MSLYTQYRPKDWDSVIGQDNIITILRHSLAKKNTGHAYIFTGSRGTGKTTSARIFAKTLNCLSPENGNPCHQCENCRAFDAGNMMDVIEIDAASHTGVENIRTMIENAHFTPTQWTYKIYIIDEVHMLSTGAFNALLKTLEEPPAHTKFILATTEIHKVPETIQSRAQRFDFRKIHKADIIKNLDFIAEKEGIKTSEEALSLIAESAQGGMRDAITMLEQYSVDKKLDADFLEQELSLVNKNTLISLLDAIIEGNENTIAEIILLLQEKNTSVQHFFDGFLYLLRDKMRENLREKSFYIYEKIFETFQKNYSSIRIFSDGILLIEMTIYEIFGKLHNDHAPDEFSKIAKKGWGNFEKNTEKKAEILEKKPMESPEVSEKIESKPQISKKNEEITENIKTKNAEKSFHFRTLLSSLKSEPILLATLKTASFETKDQHLLLKIPNKWNFDKMNEARHQWTLKEKLHQLFGGEWTVETLLQSASQEHLVDEIF